MKQILSILFTIIVTTSCTAEYGEDIPYKSVDVDYTFNLAVDGRSVSTRSLAAATDENSLYDLNAFIFDASNGKAISFNDVKPFNTHVDKWLFGESYLCFYCECRGVDR